MRLGYVVVMLMFLVLIADTNAPLRSPPARRHDRSAQGCRRHPLPLPLRFARLYPHVQLHQERPRVHYHAALPQVCLFGGAVQGC